MIIMVVYLDGVYGFKSVVILGGGSEVYYRIHRQNETPLPVSFSPSYFPSSLSSGQSFISPALVDVSTQPIINA